MPWRDLSFDPRPRTVAAETGAIYPYGKGRLALHKIHNIFGPVCSSKMLSAASGLFVTAVAFRIRWAPTMWL